MRRMPGTGEVLPMSGGPGLTFHASSSFSSVGSLGGSASGSFGRMGSQSNGNLAAAAMAPESGSPGAYASWFRVCWLLLVDKPCFTVLLFNLLSFIPQSLILLHVGLFEVSPAAAGSRAATFACAKRQQRMITNHFPALRPPFGPRVLWHAAVRKSGRGAVHSAPWR